MRIETSLFVVEDFKDAHGYEWRAGDRASFAVSAVRRAAIERPQLFRVEWATRSSTRPPTGSRRSARRYEARYAEAKRQRDGAEEKTAEGAARGTEAQEQGQPALERRYREQEREREQRAQRAARALSAEKIERDLEPRIGARGSTANEGESMATKTRHKHGLDGGHRDFHLRLADCRCIRWRSSAQPDRTSLARFHSREYSPLDPGSEGRTFLVKKGELYLPTDEVVQHKPQHFRPARESLSLCRLTPSCKRPSPSRSLVPATARLCTCLLRAKMYRPTTLRYLRRRTCSTRSKK